MPGPTSSANRVLGGAPRVALGCAALLAILFTGCSSGSDPGSGPPGAARADDPGAPNGSGAPGTQLLDEPPGDPDRTVNATDVDRAIEQVPEQVGRLLDESGVPGAAVTVVFGDEIVYAQGFGVRDVSTGDPVDSDTVFPLASLSKPISATVVSALVGRGDLGWDDPVADHDPGFALADPFVTRRVGLGDLFSHRSGLPDHAGDLLEDLGFGREEVLERLRQQPLSEFRNHYAYTNFGLTEAAVAAASTAGVEWEELTDSVLFEPAGMDRTTDSFEELMAERNRASPHVRDGSGHWVVGEQRNPQAQAPAGGVSSTAEDLGTWMRIQLADGSLDGEPIVAAGALGDMRTPQNLNGGPRTPSARSSFYGYGLDVASRDDGFVVLSHSGAFLMGAATAVGIIPGQDLGVAVITNGQPVGVPEALREIIIDLVVDGEVTRDWWSLYSERMAELYEPDTPTDWSAPVSGPTAASPPGVYAGTYDNPYYGPLEVRETGDGLEMVLGPEAMVFPLTHRDGDSFLFTPPGENSLGPTGLTFTLEDDRAASVTSEYYDATGLGTWIRS